MVVSVQIIRVKDSVSRNFIFETGEVKVQNIPQVNQSASLSIAKDSADDETEDFVINLGIKKELNLSFVLYKETIDRAEGTYTSEVKTYEEMLNYLEDIICFPGIGVVDYTIAITDKFRTRTAIYSFEDFSIDVDSKLYPVGNLKFKWKKQVI